MPRKNLHAPLMTSKKKKFVEEYLKDMEQSKAYVRAGYRAKNVFTASACSNRLLKDDKVKEAINEAIRERKERVKVDHDWVLLKLIENVNRAMQSTPVLDKEGNPIGEYKYEGAVANKALELIGKHIAFFPKDDQPIHINTAPSTVDISILETLPVQVKLLVYNAIRQSRGEAPLELSFDPLLKDITSPDEASDPV